jgi:hypothetical protein
MVHSFLKASLIGCIWLTATSCFDGPDANNNYLTKKQKEEYGKYEAKMDTSANKMLPETLIIPLQNPSDTFFIRAIKAFQAGNMQVSAAIIHKGITALKTELQETKNSTTKSADSVLASLNNLEILVRNGEITNLSEMVGRIYDAESLAAHNYLFKQGKFYPEDINGHSFVTLYQDTLNLLGAKSKNTSQRNLHHKLLSD